jgi:glycosyltransferase involved in cell wall biosynthesis
MRIGIDARALSGRFTGDRTYWRGLLWGLSAIDRENEYLLYLREPVEEGAGLKLGPNFTRRLLPSGNGRVWSFLLFPRALKKDKVDIAHVQYTVPPLMPCPVVTTIHDISFRLFPDLFAAKDRIILNTGLPSSLKRAARVIAVSENTRKDILIEFPGVPPEKVVSTPLAADPRYRVLNPSEQEKARALVNERYGLAGPYFLSLGVLQPRKNLSRLVTAFLRAKQGANLPHKLAVVGKKGWLSEETESALKAAGDAVVLTGYAPDEHLPALFTCATGFCYPSLYEGFGLPPLEAMACGCATISSNASSLPEVVGEAALQIDPHNTEAWGKAIIEVATDSALRERLQKAGPARAARFTWEKTARRTLDVYKSVYGK